MATGDDGDDDAEDDGAFSLIGFGSSSSSSSR